MTEQKKKPNQTDKQEVEKLRSAVLEWLEQDKQVTQGNKNRMQHIQQTTKKTASSEVPQKKPSKTKKILCRSIVLAAIIYVGIGAMLIFSQSTEKYVKNLTSVIPYPAAIVGTTIVSYHEWVKEIETLQSFYQREAEADETVALPDQEQTKSHIMNRLVENSLLRKLAKQYAVLPTQQELEIQIQALAEELGGTEALDQQLNQLYGWSQEDFKQKIIFPLLLKQKIEIAITTDDRINKEARDRAQEILNLTETQEFGMLAEQYSQDVTSLQKGDLGYFSRGEMVPEFERAAFSLEPGEISGLIETQFGFHIIKVTEQLRNDSGEVEQVRAQHILIRAKDLDDYLEELKKDTFIWTVVKI